MKFAARLTEPQAMSNVISALKQLGTTALLNMTPKTWMFHLTSEFTSGEQGFAELQTKQMFESYRIQSNSENMIPVLIDLRNLIRALQSAAHAQTVSVRLIKKNRCIFLSFSIFQENGDASIVQDVPVSLQLLRRVEESREPDIDPAVKLRMPDLKALKGVIDKMRSLDNCLSVTASSSGELMFSVATDMVTISTQYKNLRLRTRNAANKKDEAVSISCSIDARKFGKILSSHMLEPRLVFGCIVEGQWLVIYIQIDDNSGSLTYYLPLLPEIS